MSSSKPGTRGAMVNANGDGKLEFQRHLRSTLDEGCSNGLGGLKRVVAVICQLFLLSAISSTLLSLCHAQISETDPPRNTMITGDCEADLKPAIAVISGGVATSALKPTDAVSQLNKQLGLIRSYIHQNQGTLKELERVRMIHTERSNNGEPGGRNSRSRRGFERSSRWTRPWTVFSST